MVRLIRFIKDKLYHLTKASEPKEKIHVLDIDELSESDDVEFVIGVGVKDMYDKGIEREARKGYSLFKIDEILLDVLEAPDEKSKFLDIKELLLSTLPFHLSRSAHTPIFKYLKLIGVNNDGKYRELGVDLSKNYDRSFEDYRTKTSYRKSTEELESLSSVIQNNPFQKAAMLIPHMEPYNIDVDELQVFCITYKEQWLSESSNHRSSFRKLITLYDRLKFGWK